MIKFLDKHDELISGLILIIFAVVIFFLVNIRYSQNHSEVIKQNVHQDGKVYTGKVSKHLYSNRVEIITDRETFILSPVYGPIRIENK